MGAELLGALKSGAKTIPIHREGRGVAKAKGNFAVRRAVLFNEVKKSKATRSNSI